MIVRCPSCSTRFRLDKLHLRGKRVTLRCVRCRHTFKVDVTEDEQSPSRIHVLVAHGNADLCRSIADSLARSQMSFRICNDGREVISTMEQEVPQAVLVDVALSGVFAFDLIGRIRSHPGFGSVKVILISSVYNKVAYKRHPSSLYGADDYIEEHLVSRDLAAKVRTLLQPASSPQRTDESAPVVGNSGAPDRSTDSGGERARRLARSIVSDLVLDNRERFEEGLRTDALFEALAPQLEEGRRLLAERAAPWQGDGDGLLKEALEELIEQERRQLLSAAE